MSQRATAEGHAVRLSVCPSVVCPPYRDPRLNCSQYRKTFQPYNSTLFLLFSFLMSDFVVVSLGNHLKQMC